MKIFFISVLFLLVLTGSGKEVFSQDCQPRSSLPTLCISTETAVDSKENYTNGDLNIVETGQSEELYSGAIRIRGRGNSTWRMEKKPYRINLNTASSLLGMPASARNWVLLANHADKTLIRNAIALEMSQYLGMPYTSPFRFVDVVLNGEYLGSYLLTDHMEVRENRVDIEEETDETVPGAYLIELDGFAYEEPWYIKTGQGLLATIKYPDDRTDEHNDYIAGHIDEFESRLFDENNPGAFFEIADSTSLINWYIACELTGNPDSFWSVYLHKRRSDPHFFLGPMWDFDIAFDNDERIVDGRYRLMADVGHDHVFRRWIVQLRTDNIFMSAVKKRWNELLSGGLKEHLLSKIEEYSGLLISSGAQEENYKRWGTLNRKVYLERFLSEVYQEHVEYLSRYLNERMDWLDREINGLPRDSRYKIESAKGGIVLSGTAVVANDTESVKIREKFTGEPEMNWEIYPLSNGFFQVINSGNGLFLSRTEHNPEDVILAAGNSSDRHQHWRITETSRGEYSLLSRDGKMGVERIGGTEGGLKMVPFSIYENEEVQFWLGDSEKWKISSTSVSGQSLTGLLQVSRKDDLISLNWDFTGMQVWEGNFEIERFNETGERNLVGTISFQEASDNGYTWIDRSPLPDLAYYRLKLTGEDGLAVYSNLASVINETTRFSAGVYPNPAVEQPVFVSLYSSLSGEAELIVVNAMGIEMARYRHPIKAGENKVPLTTIGLPVGMYILKTNFGSTPTDTKFVVAR